MNSPASNEPKRINYEQLKDGQIRVLRIDKAVKDTEPIVVHLESYNLIKPGFWGWITSLQTRWYYEALSYCWGPGEKIKPIVCQGREILIHQNLYDALLVLRRLRPNVPVWIDSLCINQDDELEKKTQIYMMGTIYQRAWRVWAFLGPATADAEALIRGLPRVLKVSQTDDRYSWTLIKQVVADSARPAANHYLKAGASEEYHKRHIELLQIAPPQAQIWKSFHRLLTAEYFDRLWILQEVALAKRVTFLFGTHKLSWTEVETLMSLSWPWKRLLDLPIGAKKLNDKCFYVSGVFGAMLDSNKRLSETIQYHLARIVWHLCTSYLVNAGPILNSTLPWTYEILAFMQHSVQAQILTEALNYSRLQKCRDPQDRILGVAGILTYFCGSSAAAWIKDADTCEELYLRAFYFMATPQSPAFQQLLSSLPPSVSTWLTLRGSKPRGLSWLRLASPDTEESTGPLTLPSWCPRFHVPRSSWRSSDGFSDMKQGFYDKAWKASDLSQNICRGPDPLILNLKGTTVDEVVLSSGEWDVLDLGNFNQCAHEVDSKVQAAATRICEVLETANLMCESSGRIHTPSTGIALLKTLTLQDPALNREFLSSDDTYAELLVNIQKLAGTTSPQITYTDARNAYYLSTELRFPIWRHPSWLALLDRIDNTMLDKIFFITASGYFGLTFDKAAVEKGDTLVVFRGATVPHIVAKQEETAEDGRPTWTFCGEAYVPGIMHGEAETVEDVVEEEFALA